MTTTPSFCTSCGTQRTPATNFCTSCGEPFAPSAAGFPPVPQAGAPTPSRRTAAIVAGVAVAVLGVGGIVAAVSLSGSDEDDAADAVIGALENWVAAEAGDESACADAAGHLDMDYEEALAECLDEVGQDPGSSVQVEILTVDLVGDTGTVRARVSYMEDDGDRTDVEEFRVLKVDGTWKLNVEDF